MKGLLLNEQYGMWDAVLQEYKDQTRREHASLLIINKDPDNWAFLHWTESMPGKSLVAYAVFKHRVTQECRYARARMSKNEVVFLQEPVMDASNLFNKINELFYKYSDENGISHVSEYKTLVNKALDSGLTYGNKLYMGQDHARFFVKVTSIKMERLFDISVEDCFREGIRDYKKTHPGSPPKFDGDYYYCKNDVPRFFPTPQKAYISLVNSVGKLDHPNPWLFAYDFKKVPKPESSQVVENKKQCIKL